MSKKLSSRDIEARMQKIQDAIYDLDRELAKQGDEAALTFAARRFEIVKLNRAQAHAEVTVWVGGGLK